MNHLLKLFSLFSLVLALVACGGGGDDGADAGASVSGKSQNPQVVGTWRYTEVLGSGGFNLVTDYFVQFKANGEVLSWTGASAGSGGLQAPAEGTATLENWYTSGDQITFVNPETKKVDTFPYFVDDIHLRVNKGRIFERIG